MKYAVLLACCKHSDGGQFCVLRGFQRLLSSQGESIENGFGCPMLLLTHTVMTVKASTLVNAVSVVHKCGSTCRFVTRQCHKNIERQVLSCESLDFQHDFCNYNYCRNVYCMKS